MNLRIRDYLEISRLIQEYSEKEGLSYREALKKAKEKLSSGRAATQQSDNNISKTTKNIVTLDQDINN